MRDLIVQWLTELTQPFWHSSLSIDQFVTALQETFHMVFLRFYLVVFGVSFKGLSCL
ncbi:methionine import ATP-binding domain protein [Acinetobacter sp. 1564232]|nr:methionine import ATP-binding domain protein [Acinetobacter sp. 1564232]